MCQLIGRRGDERAPREDKLGFVHLAPYNYIIVRVYKLIWALMVHTGSNEIDVLVINLHAHARRGLKPDHVRCCTLDFLPTDNPY